MPDILHVITDDYSSYHFSCISYYFLLVYKKKFLLHSCKKQEKNDIFLKNNVYYTTVIVQLKLECDKFELKVNDLHDI